MKTNKRKAKPQVHCNKTACDATYKPRRSIPIAEVNEMIECEVRQVKASLTIYDDRSETLNQLKDNEAYLEHLEQLLHEARLQNKSIRSDLAQINLAIKRQLELDGE